MKIGDRIDTGLYTGSISAIDGLNVTVQFWEDKDYHITTWEENYLYYDALKLVNETKVKYDRWLQQKNEELQRNAAKKQTTMLVQLPSHYVICKDCEIVLEYSPMNVEIAFTGVELVHCCQCGQALRPDRGW